MPAKAGIQHDAVLNNPRQFDFGTKATIGPIGKRDIAAVAANDGTCNPKAEPHAATFLVAGIIDAHERMKDIINVRFGNAGTIVLNDY